MDYVSCSMWWSDVPCPCAGSCIQWGGRLNQGRKEWSSWNPGDARGCLFFWKRPPLGKPRCGGSTCQRSPPHRWGFTSGCPHSSTHTFHWQIHLNIEEKIVQELQFGPLIRPLNSCIHTVWLSVIKNSRLKNFILKRRENLLKTPAFLCS